MGCIIPRISCRLSGLAGPGHFLNLTLKPTSYAIEFLGCNVTACYGTVLPKDVLIFDISIILLEISLKERHLGVGVS